MYKTHCDTSTLYHIQERAATNYTVNCQISEQGRVYSWGWNEHGICGTGDEKNVTIPQTISALTGYKISLIGCGNGHSFTYGNSVT